MDKNVTHTGADRRVARDEEASDGPEAMSGVPAVVHTAGQVSEATSRM